METFSALLFICAGNSPVTGEFPAQMPVTRSFDVFLDLRLNKRLNQQWWGWWSETPLRSLWCHCNACDLSKQWYQYLSLNRTDYHPHIRRMLLIECVPMVGSVLTSIKPALACQHITSSNVHNAEMHCTCNMLVSLSYICRRNNSLCALFYGMYASVRCRPTISPMYLTLP